VVRLRRVGICVSRVAFCVVCGVCVAQELGIVVIGPGVDCGVLWVWRVKRSNRVAFGLYVFMGVVDAGEDGLHMESWAWLWRVCKVGSV